MIWLDSYILTDRAAIVWLDPVLSGGNALAVAGIAQDSRAMLIFGLALSMTTWPASWGGGDGWFD